MIKYRVIFKVSYNEAFFEFDNPVEASNFASEALRHMVDSPDQRKKAKIIIEVIDIEKEKEESEED